MDTLNKEALSKSDDTYPRINKEFPKKGCTFADLAKLTVAHEPAPY